MTLLASVSFAACRHVVRFSAACGSKLLHIPVCMKMVSSVLLWASFLRTPVVSCSLAPGIQIRCQCGGIKMGSKLFKFESAKIMVWVSWLISTLIRFLFSIILFLPSKLDWVKVSKSFRGEAMWIFMVPLGEVLRSLMVRFLRVGADSDRFSVLGQFLGVICVLSKVLVGSTVLNR